MQTRIALTGDTLPCALVVGALKRNRPDRRIWRHCVAACVYNGPNGFLAEFLLRADDGRSLYAR